MEPQGARPGRPAEGRGRAVLSFLSREVRGSRWPCPAWPLSSTHADRRCPLGTDRPCQAGLPAGVGLCHPAGGGCRRAWMLGRSAAGRPSALPLGTWACSKTAHIAAAFSSRPVFKIAWVGPLFVVKPSAVQAEGSPREAFSSCGSRP